MLGKQVEKKSLRGTYLVSYLAIGDPLIKMVTLKVKMH
jgi:hypothetical protein